MSNHSLVIYRSSAGSGKTYTLVLEYLKLVLRKPTLYRNILAITFTNKATEEMKSRIVEALAGLRAENVDDLAKQLSQETGIAVQELPQKAARVLSLILHDYSSFAVSTIDSFFGRLVRSLARELRIPLRFDLELNTARVISAITEMVFSDIGTNSGLKAWLEEFMLQKIGDDKGWHIMRDIEQLARELFRDAYHERFPGGNPGIPDHFVRELKRIRDSFEKTMTSFGDEFLGVLEKHGLEIADVKYGKSGAAAYFRKIARGPEPEDYVPGKRFNEAVADPSSLVNVKKKGNRLEESLAKGTLWPMIKRTNNHYLREYPAYAGAILVLQNIYQAGIFSSLDDKLRQFREENELILISDTNHILRKAIAGEDAPFIFEKSGNRYSHFMLDEFQDTSDYQWENLVPLVEHALASGNYTLLVGDVKQSIYRWRGGNMQLLLKGVQSRLAQYATVTQVNTLSDNYRSRERIVTFNNRFFMVAAPLLFPNENDEFRNAYRSQDLEQRWKKGVEGEGYVYFRFLETGRRDEVQDEDSEEESTGWNAAACEASFQRISLLLEKGFEYRDIAVLTRTNKEAKSITAYLLEKGITEIISPESLQLEGSPRVRMMINLIRHIDDPQDRLALVSAAYAYRRYIKGESEKAAQAAFTAGTEIMNNLLPSGFTGKLTGYRGMPVYEAVEELCPVFGLVTPDPYMQRFLDVVLDYGKKNPPNITDFLAWWDINKDSELCSVLLPSGKNAIRVMTIHKSKGLQFPVVVMPFVQWNLKPEKKSTLWVSSATPPFNELPAHLVRVRSLMKESVFGDQYENEIRLSYLDNLNVLYVAFTRAEEQLHVIAGIPAKKKESEEDELPAVAGKLVRHALDVLAASDAVVTAGEHAFESGTFTGPLRSTRKSEPEMHPLEPWISVPWKNRLQMAVNLKKIALADPDPPDTAYGTLFHELMATLTTKAHVESFAGSHPLMQHCSPEWKKRLLRDAEFFIESANQFNWFPDGAKILTETEFLLPGGALVRPDRIVVQDRHAIVIDYKTGKEEPQHEKQVIGYANVLEEMGYGPVEGFLFYPELRKVTRVAFESRQG